MYLKLDFWDTMYEFKLLFGKSVDYILSLRTDLGA